MRDLLGFLGLCRSRTYLSLAEDRAVWKPAGREYGLVVAAYNDVGLKKRMGSRVLGYPR